MRIININAYYTFTALYSLLYDSLKKRGIDCDVFVATHKNPRIVVKLTENVFHSVCFNKYDRLLFGWKSNKIYRSLVSTVDIQKYDLVHAHTVFTDGNNALRLKKEFGKKYVVAVRNVDINTFFKRMPHLRSKGLEVMKEAERLVFLSESCRNYTIETYVPPPLRKGFYDKSAVIPNGISPFFHENLPEYRSGAATPKDDLQLITVGDVCRNKNQLTVCKAAGILSRRGYHVEVSVIGRHREKGYCDRVSSSPFAKYHSYMPHDELIKNYRQTHIYVMPSLTETFGLTYVEAMSQGLPVVYSKGQGFDGQFPEGEVGFHVNSESAEEVADAVMRILSDYKAISRRCIDGTKRFSWDIIASEYEKIYREIT